MDVEDLAARARKRAPLRPVLPLPRLPEGVLHAALPTPFPVGTVNCWLLDRILALAPQAILPGHGEAFTDAEAVGERVRRYHDARLAIVHASLRDGGHGSAWDVQRRLFPTLEGYATLGAVAQVVGHLDLLVAAGRADVNTAVVPHRYTT